MNENTHFDLHRVSEEYRFLRRLRKMVSKRIAEIEERYDIKIVKREATKP